MAATRVGFTTPILRSRALQGTDAVEAHSCVHDSIGKRFLSKTQLIDKLNVGHFDPKVFVNCIQDKE